MKNKYEIFNDPVHGLIKIDEKDSVIYDLINTLEFQRLHSIKQLGHTFVVYPGCTHSRFLHMLGVYYLAKQLVDNYLINEFSEYDRLLLLISGLLHDVGHGPFSHTFELVFGLNHEQKTQEIISNPSTEIHQVLKKWDVNLPNDVASVLKGMYKNKALCLLISSQIDIDRLDYLVRDSFFSGTKYANIELHWILKSFNFQDNKIVFNFGSLFAIEQYLLARYYMHHQVYIHPRSFCKDILMKQIFLRFYDLCLQKFNFKHDYANLKKLYSNKDWPFGKISLNDFLELTDNTINVWLFQLSKENDGVLQKLCNYYYGKDYFYYYDVNPLYVNEVALITEIKKSLQTLNLNFNYFYNYEKVDAILAYASFVCKDKLIYIYGDNGEVDNLENLSSFHSGINHIFKNSAFIFTPVAVKDFFYKNATN